MTSNKKAPRNAENWPRVELVGGPCDGMRLFAPDPGYREPLGIPQRIFGKETCDEENEQLQVHWYVPLEIKDVLRKLSLFYYGYSCTTDSYDSRPSNEQLYDSVTTQTPQFPEDAAE